MNITELKVGCKAVCMTARAEKQIVTIKSITPDGRVIVRNPFGEVLETEPEKITKILGAV